jgi:hypothetical protein
MIISAYVSSQVGGQVSLSYAEQRLHEEQGF